VDEGFSHIDGAGRGGNSEVGAQAYFAGSASSIYSTLSGVGPANWDDLLEGTVVNGAAGPVPGAFWLLGFALAALGMSRRQQASPRLAAAPPRFDGVSPFLGHRYAPARSGATRCPIGLPAYNVHAGLSIRCSSKY
jgi:hypothetical protein